MLGGIKDHSEHLRRTRPSDSRHVCLTDGDHQRGAAGRNAAVTGGPRRQRRQHEGPGDHCRSGSGIGGDAGRIVDGRVDIDAVADGHELVDVWIGDSKRNRAQAGGEAGEQITPDQPRRCYRLAGKHRTCCAVTANLAHRVEALGRSDSARPAHEPDVGGSDRHACSDRVARHDHGYAVPAWRADGREGGAGETDRRERKPEQVHAAGSEGEHPSDARPADPLRPVGQVALWTSGRLWTTARSAASFCYEAADAALGAELPPALEAAGAELDEESDDEPADDPDDPDEEPFAEPFDEPVAEPFEDELLRLSVR